MSLLEEIQLAAVDGTTNLAVLLRKLKLFAARVGSQPIEDWVQFESNGYPDGAAVPDYRVWSLHLKGHFSGLAGSGLRNAPIPMACIPKAVRSSYMHYECRASIASIEDTLQRSDRETTIELSTGDLSLALGMKVYNYMNCVQVWAEFSTMNFVEVSNAVRNRVLDLAVALWREFPEAGNVGAPRSQPAEVERVTHIFNTVVTGGAASIVGVANNSSVVANAVTGDVVAMTQALSANGVALDDIEVLVLAIQAEPVALLDGKFGPRVSSWISGMVGKAASGAWNIGLGAAGSVLATVIGKYYGLG